MAGWRTTTGSTVYALCLERPLRDDAELITLLQIRACRYPVGMSRSAVLAEKPSAKERRWTYQELRAEVEETNQPCELWHGRLIMPPSPSSFHQSVTQRLEEPLRRWVERRKLGFVFHGPLDVELAPDLVFQPDVLFIAKARRGIIKTHIAGAPDLVMEVVSPACPRRDYKDKK